MCGLVGIHLRKADRVNVNLDAVLDTMLDEIEHRGGDATGFVAMTSEGVGEWQRASCGADEFAKYRRRLPEGTRTILGHTRWATQGLPAFVENNHPIRRGPFYVIHNGHVSNDHEMFKLAGRERYAQVDSEAIPAYIAHHGTLHGVPRVMEAIEGAAAIAVVDERHPLDLVLARGHSSPLNVLVTANLIMWGSTEAAVRAAHKKHIGKLPKKQRIESLPEGVALMLIDGKLTRELFAPYRPPVRHWMSSSDSWRNSTADACSIPTVHAMPKVGGWPKWDDEDEDDIVDADGYVWKADDLLDIGGVQVACDECGERVSWKEIERVPEPNSDFEWKLCLGCMDQWEDLTSEEFDKVNRAVLAAE